MGREWEKRLDPGRSNLYPLSLLSQAAPPPSSPQTYGSKMAGVGPRRHIGEIRKPNQAVSRIGDWLTDCWFCLINQMNVSMEHTCLLELATILAKQSHAHTEIF